MLLKAPREHLLSASAPHEVTGRGSGKRRRWTERFGFYAAVTDASVGGNTSVFSSQESSEDLIICHLRHQSSAGERSAQILQRRSLLSVSRGCCAKRGGQPEKDIMSDRFDCKNCNESLCGRKYIQVEDNPHCIPCYDRLYANTCQECKEIIGHNAKELFYENRHYHAHCFRCFRCDRSLADEPFTSQEDALVCSDCYCNEFSSKCVACDKTVMPGSRMLEYAGSTWHEDCFACHGCEKPIGAEAFIPDKNNYYCVPCYEGRVAPQCSHCKKALTKGGVTYKDEIWHKECFLCTGCKAPLAGQPFTSQGECPYCVKCFSSLYAKKCAGCNTAITGFGDGKYVSFEDRQWHQPCFKCSRCSVSLVGSGFFPDRDQILCSDCNNDD